MDFTGSSYRAAVLDELADMAGLRLTTSDQLPVENLQTRKPV
jgi:hypothetical protein